MGFADDFTQIIQYDGISREIMATNTAIEINNINKYEKKWKIRTNRDKFKLLKISRLKGNDVLVDNVRIDYCIQIPSQSLD